MFSHPGSKQQMASKPGRIVIVPAANPEFLRRFAAYSSTEIQRARKKLPSILRP
jgi:hypothetical protein